MGKGLARLVGSGIGFTSEAIHAARHRNKDIGTAPDSDSTYGSASSSISPSETSRAIHLEDIHDSEYTVNNEPPAYESSTPYWPDEKKQSYTQETEVTDENDLHCPRSIDEDEEAWQLDEAVEEWEGLPTYDESESSNMPGAVTSRTNVDIDAANETGMDNDTERITETDSEKTKEKKCDAMVRALVQMAGQPGPEHIQRLPYPVIIPQRRPGAKKRGFVRAYAPVLADSGISQDVFVKFISDFNKASQVCASPIRLALKEIKLTN